MIYPLLLLALAFQRLGEVRLGNANLEKVKDRLVQPADASEKRWMILLHASWFVACLAEYFFWGGLVGAPVFLAGIILLTLCQLVRHQSMAALGDSWIHLPVAYHGQKIVKSGLYSWVKHPNYFVVAIEIALVPILGKAFLTAAIFSLLNIVFLSRRIKMEESQIKKIKEKYEISH